MPASPFFYGSSVPTENFLNQKRPLRRIVGRLYNHGQSSAIIGEPRTGKTSLLEYIQEPDLRNKLYGEQADKLIFSMIDIQMLGSEFTANEFWLQALKPVVSDVVDSASESELAKQYRLCEENHFGTFTLETLFRLLHQADKRFVLLLDEFDELLNHPVLNSAEFFGGLRALASRSKGAFALVIASRISLSRLNERTKNDIKFTGSPYFNIFDEFTLGPFPERHVATLLARGSVRFTAEDRRAIRDVAGGHPFLLQAAAARMWDSYEEGLTDDAEARRLQMGTRIYREHRLHFSDTWGVWAPATRKAFTTVALVSAGKYLPDRAFFTQAFTQNLRDFQRELDDLMVAGLVTEDVSSECGWRVTQECMLWWLMDELVRVVRDDTSFEAWLRAQELENMLTKEERDRMKGIIRKAATMLQQGATTLIKAFAEGWAKGS